VSRDDIVEAARQIIEGTGAEGVKDIGKVMPVLMQQLRGRADGRVVNEVVRELLAGS
ncbi:MAG: GatB/YqeY domain-containing protein, partial [Chloroflexi bacterium]|nr:GatB/YqeY domain-containing protein [Chloroflexota bacterium]